MTRICILVLCGLPASGKTTCARRLKTSTGRPSCDSGESSAGYRLPATGVRPPGNSGVGPHGNSPCNQGVHQGRLLQQPAAHTCFIHVAYDEIMTTDTEEELLTQMMGCSSKLNDGKVKDVESTCDDQNGKELSKWKKYRKEILKCVAKHIEDCCLGENEILNKSVQESPDEDIWNTFSKSLHTSSSAKEAEENLAESKDLVYIIDDNMYYRSMRYEYYQLARKYSAGFAQVYFETSVEAAQQRNSARASSVKPEVIANMASRIEPPGGTDAFDEHTLIIPDNRNEDHFIPALLHLIAKALTDPVPALQEEDQEEKEAARVVCSTNLIHQTDQVLRRLVAQAMTQAKEWGQDKTSMKQLAAKTNKARQGILEEMRQGQLLVNSRLNEELGAGKQNDSDLCLFVTGLFDKAINENS